MTALKYTFTFLSLLGCLCPSTWTSRAKRWLYKAYSLVILVFVQYMIVIAVLDIIINVENQDQFCENFYITVASLISLYKMLNFRGRRETILMLINRLEKEPFLPMNTAEMEIKLRIEKTIQKNAIMFMMVFQSYLLVTWMSSLMRDLKLRKLAHERVWVPYDYSSLILYAVTYFHEASSLMVLTMMHFANDTLISGLMELINGQLELLEHRLQNITGDHSQSVKACARHHECIYHVYRFASKVNKQFRGILGFQFSASTFMACLILFRITKIGFGMQLYEAGLYFICTLVQLTYYCWYGNEVKLKSLEVSDMIFASDWPELDKNAMKMLLLIMQRSTFPIEFTSASIVAVNLESFMAVSRSLSSFFLPSNYCY
ncbi:odorant receptor Or1-like isoform X1 [Megalopta genalis]|uniref:odorant receptor Or1-like isoform X1 n=1 Tax=Megalopta genalis TaxID=115081 RepID=UPI003FD60607